MPKLIVALFLMGISVSSFAGTPAKQKSSAAFWQKLTGRIADTYEEPSSLTNCGAKDQLDGIKGEMTDSDKAALRNLYIGQVVGELANSERGYLGNIQRDRSYLYTAIDIAIAGTTAAGGAVGGPAAAKAFVLSATALGSVKGSIVGNFDSGTANSLWTKIQGDFSKGAATLAQNESLSYANYDIGTACIDLRALYDSGQKTSAGLTVQTRTVSVVTGGSAGQPVQNSTPIAHGAGPQQPASPPTNTRLPSPVAAPAPATPSSNP